MKCHNFFLLSADFGVSAKNTKTLQRRDSFIGTPYWWVMQPAYKLAFTPFQVIIKWFLMISMWLSARGNDFSMWLHKSCHGIWDNRTSLIQHFGCTRVFNDLSIKYLNLLMNRLPYHQIPDWNAHTHTILLSLFSFSIDLTKQRAWMHTITCSPKLAQH